MEQKNSLILFQGKGVRRIWFNEEWWFSVVDVIAILTDSSDPKQYIKKMRNRDSELNSYWGTICTPLELLAPDGKRRKTNCVSVKGAFRIIQSIRSKKAEPFKRWLAEVGHERIQEIENPELAQKRMKEIYKAKGYPKSWIEKRIRGIAIRQDLTDEWEARGVKKRKEYAILTNEISKATFGMTPSEYKNFKGLKRENLRDHMNDLELIFTMLGERMTTELSQEEEPDSFTKSKDVAKRGGKVAGSARKDAEKELGRPVISGKNHLSEPEKKKKLQDKTD